MPITVSSIRQDSTHRFAPGAFALTVGGFDPELVHVRSFRGRERLSRPFVFDVRVLVSPDVPHGHFDRGLLDAGAHLVIGDGSPGTREVRGVVTRIRSNGHDAQGRGAYELRIMPAIARLGQRRARRIFQEKTVVEIVTKVLEAAPIEVLPKLKRIYPKRTYCVQYDETDLAFAHRLLAEEGIFYFFRHSETHEHLVLGDAPMAYPYVADSTIPMVVDRGLGATDDHIDEIVADRVVRPGKATIREFDFLRPTLHQTVETAVPPPVDPAETGYAEADLRSLEIYDHYDEFEGGDLGKEVAAMHLDAHRRGALVFRGRGTTRRAAPGFRFDCDFPLAHDLGRELCFVRVDHEGTAPTLPNEPAAGGAREPYVVRFTAVPASVTFRPKRPKRRAQQVLETARVVGPKGAQIHVDELGRVKVKFHWDRENKDDGTSSCWIRVSQVWAGTGWGFQFVPRIGMEVLVSFLTGDTDKPVILGAVGNTETPEIYTLPENKTKSGIRTRSVRPETADDLITGYNEISFEDNLGHEQLHIQAEREMSELVKGDRHSTIGGSDTTSVGGNSRWVTGASSTYLTAIDRQNIVGGSETITIGAHYTFDAAGTGSFSVGRTAGFAFGATLTFDVADTWTQTIGGALAVAVGGDQTVTVGGASRAEVAGPIVAASGSGIDLLAGSTVSIDAGGAATITSATKITLSVGTSTIQIEDNEISIHAENLTLRGNDKTSVVGSNAKLDLDGDAHLVGGTTTLQGSGGEVELDSDVVVSGGSISLKSGGGGGHSNSSDSSSTERENVHLDIGVDVGHGRENTTTGALVFKDKDGNEITRKEASSATVRANGRLVFDIDVEEHPDPVTVSWIDGADEHHIAGPARLAKMRDAFQAGDHAMAGRLHGRRSGRAAALPGRMSGRPVRHEQPNEITRIATKKGE